MRDTVLPLELPNIRREDMGDHASGRVSKYWVICVGRWPARWERECQGGEMMCGRVGGIVGMLWQASCVRLDLPHLPENRRQCRARWWVVTGFRREDQCVAGW